LSLPSHKSTDELLAYIADLEQEIQRLKQHTPSLRSLVEAFMEHSFGTCWIKDDEGRLRYINKAFKKFIASGEFSTTDWYGKTDTELWEEDVAIQTRESDVAILTSGQPDSSVVELKHSDGIHQWLAYKFRILDSNDRYCVCCLSFDITKYVTAEQGLAQANSQLAQASEEKRKLLALIDDELDAPIASILASVQQIENDEHRPYTVELIDYINQGTARLRSKINNLVWLAKSQSADLVLQSESFNCKSLIGKIFDHTRGLLVTGVDIVFNYDDSIPRMCIGDPCLIEHMVRSVLENACKNTEHGRVRLHVSWEPDGGHLVFVVEDSSNGMTEERQALMYRDVVKIIMGTARDDSRVDSSLIVCHRLAALLHADVVLDSVVGQGTTVEMRIPLGVVTGVPIAVDDIVDEAHAALLVQNCPLRRGKLGTLIESMGYSVDIVESSTAALERLDEKSYGVIFMDLDLPVMDGVTATRWIRRRGISTTIVAVVSNSDSDIRRRCVEVGIDDFLEEPVTRSAMLRVLERQLKP
jgi:signal transduction histidine kinase/CheY-like chemotaxis protein